MTKSGKIFADDLTECLLETGFKRYQCQMSIYYKYEPDGSNFFVLSYVDDCVYWYDYEDIGKCFVDALGNIFHVKFLGYENWFISTIIYHLKENYISVDQARYVMTKYGKIFADDLTECLLETGFKRYQCHMSIYYKYEPYGSKIVVLSYVDDCVYWYDYEDIGKWFVDALGNIFHVKFLGYEHWFMSTIIHHMKKNYISVDQARYDTSILAKYLDTATINTSIKFIIPV